jgi:hypothetical protein
MITSAIFREKDPPKPFLEFEIKELRSFEISPKSNYIVFNVGRYVFIKSLSLPERLVKVMKPFYMACDKGISMFKKNTQQVQINEDKLK